MTTSTIRKKLISYLADADDSKVKAIYTLLEKEIQPEDTFTLTDEQLKILEKEQELHLSGQSKSYTRDQARQIIKGQRNFFNSVFSPLVDISRTTGRAKFIV
jgi:hypothetical protein